MENKTCLCGSEKSFKDCCLPLLENTLQASNPEQLMRSRYSAYCAKNAEYLLRTLLPSKRKPNELQLIANNMEATHWLGLKVIAAGYNENNKQTGWVEFAAFYRQTEIGMRTEDTAPIENIYEKSQFILEDGRWYYVEGEFLKSYSMQRNEMCFCGSGKKYKKCHV